MRAAPTQGLTDGELSYIIENGVRFTGMPAFGSGKEDPAGEKLAWQQAEDCLTCEVRLEEWRQQRCPPKVRW